MNALIYLQPLTPVLSAILVAVLADILLRLAGSLRDRIDPLLGIPAGIAAILMRKLNRPERAKHVRFARGIVTALLILLLGMVLGTGLEALARRVPMLQPLLWFLCLRVTFPWNTGRELLTVWKEDKNDVVTRGLAVLKRRRVPVLVPATKPDRFAIARMFIEATAMSLHRGLLSPVLWGLVAALLHGPALLVAVLVASFLEAERIVVTQETKESAFAAGFEMVETVIDFVPARIAALFWVLGAVFTPGANPLTSLRAMFVKSSVHRAVNAGWPVAAVAGALRVALQGGRKRDAWIAVENATAKAEALDMQRAIWLHAVTLGITLLVLAALLLLSIGM